MNLTKAGCKDQNRFKLLSRTEHWALVLVMLNLGLYCHYYCVEEKSLMECDAVMFGKYKCSADVIQEPVACTIVSTRLLSVTSQTTAVLITISSKCF